MNTKKEGESLLSIYVKTVIQSKNENFKTIYFVIYTFSVQNIF